MNPDDEAGMNRVLDTLQIPRGVAKSADIPGDDQKSAKEITPPLYRRPSPTNSPPQTAPSGQPQLSGEKENSINFTPP